MSARSGALAAQELLICRRDKVEGEGKWGAKIWAKKDLMLK